MELFEYRPHHNILNVFAEEKNREHGFLRASAPMVRYSKLEFRQLLRQNGVKLCFTPMIIADSYNNSQKARDNEFTTCGSDQPVIAQFAARNESEFVLASQLIYPYVDGVDLNCGCPQSWAIAKGYGCGLLRQPQLVQDIVRAVRRTLPQDFSVSLKIRLLNGAGEESVRATVELARQLEKCGASFITLHGRNMWQRVSDPLNVSAMSEVKRSLQIPLIVNGNVRSWQDACRLHQQTGADGVMAARGLLSNPGLYNVDADKNIGYDSTLNCVQQWLDIDQQAGDNLNFQCFHHHLTFMCSSHMKRHVRLQFNNFTQKAEVYEFFAEHYGIRPSVDARLRSFEYTKCTYGPYNADGSHWEGSCNEGSGKFFNEFTTQADKAKEQEDMCELEGSFFAQL